MIINYDRDMTIMIVSMLIDGDHSMMSMIVVMIISADIMTIMI